MSDPFMPSNLELLRPDFAATFLTGGGEMGARMRAHDWATSRLGPLETWPQALRTMVAACLNSPLLGTVLWGPDLVMLYNDAYIPSMADRHPAALGCPVAEVWGETWLQTAAPFKKAMETGQGFEQKRVELSMVRRGQSETTWWDITATPIRGEDGSVVGLFNQGVEITSQIRAEQAMRQAKDEFQALNATLESRIVERTNAMVLYQNIINSHPAPVCAFDLEYRLIAFNQAHSDEFFRIFGHRVKLGDIFPDLFPPDQGTVMRALMTRALAGETYTVVEEFGDPQRAKPIWELAYYPLRDVEGHLMGAFHHASDISGRLRAQAELQVAQEALRQSQKMESVGQLTGGIAHDFNNMLATIMSSLELMNRRITSGKGADLTRYLTMASTAAQSAAALIKRLLAFSRKQTLDLQALDVNAAIAQMQDMFIRRIGENIQFELALQPDLPIVRSDHNQLESALLNLVINARDAMPDGGLIRISTSNRLLDAGYAVIHPEVIPGSYVMVSVSDDGSGMSPEVVAKAFDPFFTTKPIGQGTGLGLSMLYGFARQTKGHASIHSIVGEGTTVNIYLPCDSIAAASSVTQQQLVACSPKGQGQTVLFVEDEPGVRLVLGEVLGELGYVTFEAIDAPSALALEPSLGPLDLLVTDVGLPGINGRQLAEMMRQRRPNLKVLFVTGYANKATVKDEFLGRGMDMLAKPFTVDDLAHKVQTMMNMAMDAEASDVHVTDDSDFGRLL